MGRILDSKFVFSSSSSFFNLNSFVFAIDYAQSYQGQKLCFLETKCKL